MTERQSPRFADPFETWLVTGLATEPAPDVSERIDRRVRAAIDRAPIPLAQRRLRLGRRSRGLLVVAATVAVMGAGAGILGLFGTIFGPVEGWRVAFDRAERLDVVVTSGDVRARVIRAYADANLVFIFMVNENIHDQQRPDFDGIWTLVDDRGIEYQGTLASAASEQTVDAAMFVFQTPEPWLDGSRSFTFTIPFFRDPRATLTDPSPDAGLLAGGPYVFEFEVTSQGGQMMTPGPPATANGTTVELRSLVLAPTAVRGLLAIDPPPPGDRNYFRIFVRVGGRSIDGLTHGEIEGTDPLLLPFDSVAGFDDPDATGAVEVQAIVPPGGDTSKTFVPVETWIIPFELR